MTESEFNNEVMAAFTRTFPSTMEWLAKFNAAGRAAILSQWHAELADQPVYSVTGAIERIHVGDQPGPAAYDRESWPAFILRAIREWNPAEPDATWRRDAVECRVCDDLGSVACFSPDALERLLAAPQTPDEAIEAMPPHWIQCTCARGKDYWHYPNRPAKPLAKFDRERIVPTAAGVPAFREFVRAHGFRLQPWFQSKWQPAETEPYVEFAEWAG